MLNTVFSCLYWLFLGVTMVPLYGIAILIWLLTKPFDPKRSLLHRYTCWWAALYLRCLPGCRIQVEGREKILPNTPYVLVANHQSMADIMAISALGIAFKWVSKKEACRVPFIGWNMKLNGYVSVDRGNLGNVAQMMECCRQWLKRGVPLVMFPEGHRSPTGEMQKFHNGSFKLAAQSGCAVVPIVVDGTVSIFRGIRVAAFPGRIRIRVLDPVTLEQAGGKVGAFRDRVAERMRQELTAMRS